MTTYLEALASEPDTHVVRAEPGTCPHGGGCPCPADEHPCRSCPATTNECDGPPLTCCSGCTHWAPLPHPTDDTTSEDGDPR